VNEDGDEESKKGKEERKETPGREEALEDTDSLREQGLVVNRGGGAAT
jgi:hypothetical protein